MAAKEVPSVWTRSRRGREQPALSQDQIVAEALRLLDAEGIEALSMRRLGTQLGAAATSLYRHVANRDELIELVVDEVYAEIEVPEVSDPAKWRAAVAVCAKSTRAALLRHPWIASVIGQVGLSYLGPNVMRLNDGMLGMFHAAGFSLAEADRALYTLMSYVIGAGISEAAWLSTVARSGQSEQEWLQRLRPAVEQAAVDYPRLREVQDATPLQDPARLRDDNFDHGLNRVLDGLEPRIGRADD